MIKAILFDLDNTLVDRQKIFTELLYRRFSLIYSDKKLLDEVVNDILRWDNRGNLDRLLVFKKYVEKYHPQETAEELNDYWMKHSGEEIYIMDGAQQVLEQLHQKYRLGVISNGNTLSQRRKYNNLPFKDLFEYSIISGEIGIMKPDARIFLKACADMKLKPEECVYVGDNYRCDIQGALNAHLIPIWLNDQKDEQVITIKTLFELEGALCNL